MDRRLFVLCTTSAISTALAGCLGGDGDDNVPENTEATDSPDESSEYQYDESRQDSVFVENMEAREAVVDVLMEHTADSEVVINNTYRVPAETGLEIPDIATVEAEYDVTAIYDETTEEYNWTVLTCAHEDGPEAGGETALGIEVDERYDGNLGIYLTDCDESGAGERGELTYDNHEDYVID